MVAAHLKTLVSLYNQGRLGDVIELGETLIDKHPQHPVILNILGAANTSLGRFDRAIDCYKKALLAKPGYVDAYYNLGNTFQSLGRHEDAIACFSRVVQIKPRHAEAHNNRGNSLKRLNRYDEAIASFTRAVQSKPDYAEAHNNLGNILKNVGRRDEASECFAEALRIKPAFAEAHYNLGNNLRELERWEEAIASFARAVEIKPDFAAARFAKLIHQVHVCEWDAIGAAGEEIAALGVSGSDVTPFSLLSLEDNPERHRIRSERYAQNKYHRDELPRFSPPAIKPDRLRIGYFSADFHKHPGMNLMARLFEVHDRNRFAVHAFSFGPETNDEMRARLTAAFDVFHDVRSLSDMEVAELARNEAIDIAINRNGYTLNERSAIFAYRAAPVQISYLGYPGTLGAPFIDYLIADKFIIPAEYRDHYTEKIIYLPDTYQANDNTREISDRPVTRSEMGLPEQGLVFCCFNNNSKLMPREFNIWMRLLKNVEGSVLWLYKSRNSAAANLRKEAQERGIDPDRLVFAERLSLPEHLARHRLADLFLDTFNYNAHTTASDALWAGLPVVTKIGRGFAARVAGSLLTAVGLPELITTTDEDYERLALELAANPDKLRVVKEKLAENRNSAPLFDTERFVKHIEDAYQQAYQRYFEGKDPDDIIVKGCRLISSE